MRYNNRERTHKRSLLSTIERESYISLKVNICYMKMEKQKKRLMFFTGSSIAWNIIMALYKISLSYMSHSALILLYAFYNISLVITKTTFIKKVKDESEKYYLVGLIVVISSISYIIYSIKMLLSTTNIQYNMYMAIGISVVTFFDIALSLIGIRKARKKMNIEEETSKLISFATSLISLSLTQSAILSFTKSENISYYTGLGGIVFGSLSMIVGIYMIFYIKSSTNYAEKN